MVVGLDDGKLDGVTDGCIEKLGDVVGPEDGELVGNDDVDGIVEGLVDGAGFGLDGVNAGERVDGNTFVATLPSLFVVDWLLLCDGLPCPELLFF